MEALPRDASRVEPAGFGRSDAVRRLGLLTAAALLVALFLIGFVAREASDAMGGQLQRIFYIHVPSAWAAYLGFALVFVGSIAYLRTRARRWDLVAHAAAEVGVLFCTIVLITGPIWAKPVWGTWWQWDARLTSALVLWLTYVGYLFLRAFTADRRSEGRLAAVVGILGFVNVPIVHFAVQWWRTLHPSGPSPADLVSDSGLGGQELSAFFVSLGAITLLFAWLLVSRIRLGRAADILEELEVEASRMESSIETGPVPAPAAAGSA